MDSALSMPKVSIGMPIFNAGEFLKASVDSIFRQSYQDWELIIIDDGSSDGSTDFLERLSDPRLVFIKEHANLGLACRLNQAISISKGQYFARMDGDDISHPRRLESQITFLDTHPTIDLVAAKVEKINETGEVIGTLPYAESHSEICSAPWQGFYMPHPAWMGKTEWFRKHPYAIPAHYRSEDQELLLRTYKYSKFANLSQTLLFYRVHSKINIVKMLKTHISVFNFQYKYFFKNYPLYIIPASAVLIGRLFKACIYQIIELKKLK